MCASVSETDAQRPFRGTTAWPKHYGLAMLPPHALAAAGLFLAGYACSPPPARPPCNAVSYHATARRYLLGARSRSKTVAEIPTTPPVVPESPNFRSPLKMGTTHGTVIIGTILCAPMSLRARVR